MLYCDTENLFSLIENSKSLKLLEPNYLYFRISIIWNKEWKLYKYVNNIFGEIKKDIYRSEKYMICFNSMIKKCIEIDC